MSKYFLELKSGGTSPSEGRRTTSRLSALLLLSLCAALDDGSAGTESRRHLVMTPTDTEKQMIVIALMKKKLSSIYKNNLRMYLCCKL